MRFAIPIHRLILIPLAVAVLLSIRQGLAQEPAPFDPIAPVRNQDSFALTRLNSGVLPPDGLLSLTMGYRQSTTVLIFDDLLGRISMLDYFLKAEANLLPWMGLRAELPWRTWSDGQGWIPPSGSGLGDGSWQLTAGRSLLPGGSIHGAFFGGGNLPVGSEYGSGTVVLQDGVRIILECDPSQ